MMYDWSLDSTNSVARQKPKLTDPILFIEACQIEHCVKLGRSPDYGLYWWHTSGEAEMQRRKELEA